jgi:deoxyribose-phosphate aldolase
MPTRVITVADLRHASKEFRIPPGTIVTPAARDHADSRGITIVFAANTPTAKAAVRNERIDIARRIDHTILHPDAVESDILNLCAEATEHRFAAVCVNPTLVATATRALQGTDVHVCTVVGFPTGAHPTSIKVAESAGCVDAGAQEIDIVANSGWLKDGRHADYAADILAVRKRIGDGVILKVIIEAALLTQDQIVRAATLASHSGSNYVKTSTGVYSKARPEDVRLLRRALPERIKIKAAGGIRTAADAASMIAAGADRIGTSNSIAIVWESKG